MVSSLEGYIIFLMPRRFGERPQATVPSCYLDGMSTSYWLLVGVQIRWVFGQGTFTQKKGNFVNSSRVLTQVSH